jgi:hypothetical protein
MKHYVSYLSTIKMKIYRPQKLIIFKLVLGKKSALKFINLFARYLSTANVKIY